MIQEFPLYNPRPEFYKDLNHYGPLFSYIIAPFALLPDYIGAPLWMLALTSILYFSIKDLNLKTWQHIVIFWLCLNSLIGSLTNVQFNIASVALIIYSYTLIRKEKDVWAAFVIMLGVFVKLYGIVGFAFFLFSKHKPKLILWSFIWGAIFFALPMLISSPDFIIKQYVCWFHDLIAKNGINNTSLMQNVSVFGMIKRVSGHYEWSNLPVLLGGLLISAIPYVQFRKYKEERFQLLTLALVLIFTVIFSTGSEPNTYIFAIVGAALWFVIQPRPFDKIVWILLILVMWITSFGNSFLFPHSIYRTYILPYAFQVIPCVLIWLRIVYELIVTPTRTPSNEAINSNSRTGL
ncbi:MAG: glycosyltransferase family 87 protein [Bacteroidota bacterium]|nr:glycosyltransferase family 87 protein [Bacteroidota bacterium]